METCGICGGQVCPTVIKEWGRPTTPKVTIYEVECDRCEQCGEEYLSPVQLKSAEKKTNAALRAAKGLLSASEVDALTKTLAELSGLPDMRIAEGLGISRVELHRWRTDERFQSQLADVFLRYVAKNPAAFADFLREVAQPLPKRGRPRKQIG